jgi:hypothetical protein
MRKEFARTGSLELDIAVVRRLRERLEKTYKLFINDIDKHGCWKPARSVSKRKTKARGRRK